MPYPTLTDDELRRLRLLLNGHMAPYDEANKYFVLQFFFDTDDPTNTGQRVYLGSVTPQTAYGNDHVEVGSLWISEAP